MRTVYSASSSADSANGIATATTASSSAVSARSPVILAVAPWTWRRLGHHGRMYGVRTVDVPRRPVAALQDVVGLPRTTRLLAAATDFRNMSDGRVIWNVSSTESGGGVADMLQVLVGYTKDLAIDSRWLVISGDGEFFRITKRLHNRIHGRPGDGGALGAAERAHVDDVMAANVASLGDKVGAGDLVLLHDPQTAGLVGPLSRRGAHVVWRSHIGIDGENDVSRSAWEFLQPLLADAEAYVFTRHSYVPQMVPASQAWIIQPSIDPFSPKNQPMDPAAARAALVQMGVLAGDATGSVCRYVRRDGSPGEMSQPASVVAEALPGPDEPAVIQVSRWDRLKDMAGVMRGFAEHVAPSGPGWLVLAGPSVDGVTDDPEGYHPNFATTHYAPDDSVHTDGASRRAADGCAATSGPRAPHWNRRARRPGERHAPGRLSCRCQSGPPLPAFLHIPLAARLRSRTGRSRCRVAGRRIAATPKAAARQVDGHEQYLDAVSGSFEHIDLVCRCHRIAQCRAYNGIDARRRRRRVAAKRRVMAAWMPP